MNPCVCAVTLLASVLALIKVPSAKLVNDIAFLILKVNLKSIVRKGKKNYDTLNVLFKRPSVSAVDLLNCNE